MVTITDQDGVVVMRFDEAYNALDEPHMQATARAVLDFAQQGAPSVVCDLSRTKYFGSAFIEILARASQRLRSRGGDLVLCGLQPFCKRVLTAAQLNDVWEMYITEQEAVAALRPNA